MRRTNGIAAGLGAIVTFGMAANAGQSPPAGTPFDKMKMRVVTDKKTYSVNAPIKMTFTIKNISAQPIMLTFASGLRRDFQIYHDKNTLWQWSKGRMFTMDIGTETLGAGKILTYTETYKPGTPNMPALTPGTYTLSAYPTTMDKVSKHTETTFKVVAGK